MEDLYYLDDNRENDKLYKLSYMILFVCLFNLSGITIRERIILLKDSLIKEAHISSYTDDTLVVYNDHIPAQTEFGSLGDESGGLVERTVSK